MSSISPKLFSIASSQSRMELTSIKRLRLIRLPPLSLIPRQFLNSSVMRASVGMVVMVLSQLRTFTVVRPICSTSPSALWLGISSQSRTPVLPSPLPSTAPSSTSPQKQTPSSDLDENQ
mgnify:CR=1 FL=1